MNLGKFIETLSEHLGAESDLSKESEDMGRDLAHLPD